MELILHLKKVLPKKILKKYTRNFYTSTCKQEANCLNIILTCFLLSGLDYY